MKHLPVDQTTINRDHRDRIRILERRLRELTRPDEDVLFSPGAIAYRSTNQTIATYPAQVPVTFDSVVANNAPGIFTVNGSDFTATKAGRWHVNSSIAYLGNATGGQREMWHEHNHAYNLALGDANPPPNGVGPVVVSIVSTVIMAKGDTIRAIAQQDSGGDLAIYRALMSATFLSP